MAFARVKSRGTGVTLDIEVDSATTVRALRDVRRQIGKDFDQVMAMAAEEVVLPDARRRAGHLKVGEASVAAALVVRKRRTAPYMTSRLRGSKARAVGLLEFGGTVRAEIRPRHGKALVINGQPVARVTKARHYRAHRFMYGAVDAKVDVFGDRVRDELVAFFAHKGFEVT
jgi:hypothetical protein